MRITPKQGLMEAVEAGRIGSVKMTMKPEQMSKLKYEKSVQKENETRSSLSSIPRTLSARINAGYQHYHSPSICRFQSSLQSTLNISSSLFHRSIGAGDHSFCSFLASLLCGEGSSAIQPPPPDYPEFLGGDYPRYPATIEVDHIRPPPSTTVERIPFRGPRRRRSRRRNS